MMNSSEAPVYLRDQVFLALHVNGKGFPYSVPPGCFGLARGFNRRLKVILHSGLLSFYGFRAAGPRIGIES